MIDFNKEIVDLMDHTPFPTAYRTPEAIAAATVEVEEDGQKVQVFKEELLPKETIGRVMVNCASKYLADDVGEGFYLKILVDLIRDVELHPREVEIKEKLKQFIIKMMTESVLVVKDGKYKSGVYHAWVIAQALQECGLIPNDIEMAGEDMSTTPEPNKAVEEEVAEVEKDENPVV